MMQRKLPRFDCFAAGAPSAWRCRATAAAALLTAGCRSGRPDPRSSQRYEERTDVRGAIKRMIHESRYWKDDLLKFAASLERRLIQKRWYDGTFADVEKTVMLGFYAIRKLTEAHKLDDKTSGQSVAVTVYPATGKFVTRTNWHHWWELYDMEGPWKAKVQLTPLCHQFVHSYVFSCAFDETRAFESVLVSSDRDRNRLLYSVPVAEVIRVFRRVGKNYPNFYHSEFNESKGDYDVVIKTAKHGEVSVR